MDPYAGDPYALELLRQMQQRHRQTEQVNRYSRNKRPRAYFEKVDTNRPMSKCKTCGKVFLKKIK